MIDIQGLDKGEVLHALWHASHVQGMSFLGLPKGGKFTVQRAKRIVKERLKNITNNDCQLYFDYVDGHVIKCNLGGDTFDECLFDRDCGAGAAQRAIDNLRAGFKPSENSSSVIADLLSTLIQSRSNVPMKKLRRSDALNYRLAEAIIAKDYDDCEFVPIKDFCELIKAAYKSMPEGRRFDVIFSVNLRHFFEKLAEYCRVDTTAILKPAVDLDEEFSEVPAADEDKETLTVEKLNSALDELVKYHPTMFESSEYKILSKWIELHAGGIYVKGEVEV